MSATCPVCGQTADFVRDEAEDGTPVLRDDATQCLSAAEPGERTAYVHVDWPTVRTTRRGPDFDVTGPRPIGGGPPINELDWDDVPRPFRRGGGE